MATRPLTYSINRKQDIMSSDNKPIVFLTSSGEEISNDPRWRAQKVLGVSSTDNSAQLEAALLEIEELRRQLADPSSNEAVEEVVDEEETPEAGVEGDQYTTMTAKELKTLAIDRGVNLKGLTKASQVREALRALDAAE